MGDFTTTVPTILAGSAPSGDQWKTVTDELSALSGAWSAWTSTVANLTIGTTVVSSRYRRIGKTIDFRWKFSYSAGAGVGTAPTFTLPAAPSTVYTAAEDLIGDVQLLDSGTAHRRGHLVFTTGSTVTISYYDASCVLAQVTASLPHVWATGDSIVAWGTYETA